MVLFISKLNDLQPYATDIGNAYLEAHTTKTLRIVAPPEFGEQADHLLIMNKVLYGFCSSGQNFNENLGKCLQDLGFQQS